MHRSDMVASSGMHDRLVSHGTKARCIEPRDQRTIQAYIAKPVMVIVDVRPDTVGIPTDAYYAVEEIKEVRTLRFSHTAMLPTPPRILHTIG